MHQQLTQEYQDLFDIQLSDMTSLKIIKDKEVLVNSPQTVYQLSNQIRTLEETIYVRSKQLQRMDDLIIYLGSKTIKDLTPTV